MKAAELLKRRIKTDEEKKQWWDNIMLSRSNQLEIICKACKNTTQEIEVAALAVAELINGKCPRCEIKWREIEFENLFGYVHYFEPGCECYPLCPNCKKWLYVEQASGYMAQHEHRCRHCGWQLLDDNCRKRYGPNYDYRQFAEDRREWLDRQRGNVENEAGDKKPKQYKRPYKE